MAARPEAEAWRRGAKAGENQDGDEVPDQVCYDTGMMDSRWTSAQSRSARRRGQCAPWISSSMRRGRREVAGGLGCASLLIRACQDALIWRCSCGTPPRLLLRKGLCRESRHRTAWGAEVAVSARLIGKRSAMHGGLGGHPREEPQGPRLGTCHGIHAGSSRGVRESVPEPAFLAKHGPVRQTRLVVGVHSDAGLAVAHRAE